MSYLWRDETLFKDESVFDSRVHSGNPPPQGEVVMALAMNLKPELKNLSPVHTILFWSASYRKNFDPQDRFKGTRRLRLRRLRQVPPREDFLQGRVENLRKSLRIPAADNRSFRSEIVRADMREARGSKQTPHRRFGRLQLPRKRSWKRNSLRPN